MDNLDQFMNYLGVDFTDYKSFCKFVTLEKFFFNNFKRHSSYAHILEHVTFDQGKEYIDAIYKSFQITEQEIKNYCHINDSFGNPDRYLYGKNFWASPTSLRYTYHALHILQYLQNIGLQALNIVEVGGGYGGLLLAINQFAPKFQVTIKKYHIIDLEDANVIIEKYLAQFTVDFPYSIHDANNYGKDIDDENLFFISNYCFSEIAPHDALKYSEVLLPKCPHGFIVWNMRPFFEFGKKIISRQLEFESVGSYCVYF